MGINKIVFLTGTRADFGKLKPLIEQIERSDKFECHVYVTGMHMLAKYDSTFGEIDKQNYSSVYKHINQTDATKMDIILSNTIVGFHNYIYELKPDLVIVHGDRVEAFAAGIVSAFNNILLGHIEGGEVSGTIDESVRHAITKLAHIHFVANEESQKRLIHMGEDQDSIFVIGSPDIDIMLSDKLPSIEKLKTRYRIPFERYSIFMYHPVTTELDFLQKNIRNITNALICSGKEYVIIYPNNDEGTNIIIKEITRLERNMKFRIIQSMRFEYFITLLKNCEFVIGNSSAGIREAEVFGIKSINIGTRQNNRTKNENVINVAEDEEMILEAINNNNWQRKAPPEFTFGRGNSAEQFMKIMNDKILDNISIQKKFHDVH